MPTSHGQHGTWLIIGEACCATALEQTGMQVVEQYLVPTGRQIPVEQQGGTCSIVLTPTNGSTKQPLHARQNVGPTPCFNAFKLELFKATFGFPWSGCEKQLCPTRSKLPKFKGRDMAIASDGWPAPPSSANFGAWIFSTKPGLLFPSE